MKSTVIYACTMLFLLSVHTMFAADNGGIAIRDGQTIVFVGDSITVAAAGPTGYGTLLLSALKSNGIVLKSYCAGGSGANSTDLLTNKYLFPSALARKPDWITISCGVNDAKRDGNACPIDQYRKNITAIVEQAQAANIQILILTTTAWECLKNDDYHRRQIEGRNQLLQPYNEFLRTLAVERKCYLAEVNTAFQSIQKSEIKQDGVLTLKDGCHPNAAGHKVIAHTILKSLGASDQQLQQAEALWTASIAESAAKP